MITTAIRGTDSISYFSAQVLGGPFLVDEQLLKVRVPKELQEADVLNRAFFFFFKGNYK